MGDTTVKLSDTLLANIALFKEARAALAADPWEAHLNTARDAIHTARGPLYEVAHYSGRAKKGHTREEVAPLQKKVDDAEAIWDHFNELSEAYRAPFIERMQAAEAAVVDEVAAMLHGVTVDLSLDTFNQVSAHIEEPVYPAKGRCYVNAFHFQNDDTRDAEANIPELAYGSRGDVEAVKAMAVCVEAVAELMPIVNAINKALVA